MNGHNEQALAATMPTEEEWARIQDAEEESDSPEFDPEPTDPWDDLTEEQQDMYLIRRAWGGW